MSGLCSDHKHKEDGCVQCEFDIEWAKCEDCGKPAEWIYTDDTYLCDDCVPRGVCNCQRQYVDTEWYEPPTFNDHPFIWGNDKHGRYWTSVDEKGREYPCVDWMKL